MACFTARTDAADILFRQRKLFGGCNLLDGGKPFPRSRRRLPPPRFAQTRLRLFGVADTRRPHHAARLLPRERAGPVLESAALP